ncbi:hypothetical protein [Flavobacterium urocaniciphilum]|uniref:Uncharacterized protein n=1 Tax=Flavobacterium urocaniciphilum TaxID=1299341 RepID=A0A1H9ASB9_9FLAO|nr:hypothetical protein [Flavobacterium urocaniciphilum]SEP78808.1 hypothetical protein SAMN05444005_102276 [Flavobacterium urocaniciphilum]
MKTLKIYSLATIFSVLSFSCDNENLNEDTTSPTNQNLMTLNKKVIHQTYESNPSADYTRIQYYSNNEVIADTVFNYLNEWTSRYIKVTTGNAINTQQLNTNGEIISQQEITYDNQGRIIQRRTDFPNNVMVISFEYNSDNSVIAKATNTLDNSVINLGTFFKNNDGLIYKKTPYNSTGSIELIYDGLKPTAMTSPTQTHNFDYFTNPMPLNILKTTTQLNNMALSNLTLTPIAQFGNFYYKPAGNNYIANFNSNNYLEYTKTTDINSTNNTQMVRETFYYYN